MYQIDIKLVFLNGFINVEVYVSQPSGFDDHENLGYIFKFKRAFYGLKQAHRVEYGRLSCSFLSNKDLILVK